MKRLAIFFSLLAVIVAALLAFTNTAGVPEKTDSLLSTSPNIRSFGDIGEFLSLRMGDIIQNISLVNVEVNFFQINS